MRLNGAYEKRALKVELMVSQLMVSQLWHSGTASSSNEAECDVASEEGLQLVWEHYTEGTSVSSSGSKRLLSEFKAAAHR